MKSPTNSLSTLKYKDVLNAFSSQKKSKLDTKQSELSSYYRTKLKIIDTMAAILGISGISIEYYLVTPNQTQILFYVKPKYTISSDYNTLCYINIVLTLVLRNPHTVIFILCHYLLRSRLLRIQKANLENGVLDMTLFNKLIIELIVCSIVSLPNVNLKWTGSMRGNEFTYHITDIIMILSLLRCYLILRLYVQYSKWTSYESSQICKKYGATPNAIFAMKSDLKDRPFISITVAITSLVVIFGIAVMQSEKSYQGVLSNMDYLTNAQWLTIITMATVGYGDFFPETHFGRFFCLIACISGMVLVSALIVALNLVSDFDNEQRTSFIAIRRTDIQKKWFDSASNVIKAAFQAKRVQTGLIKKFKALLYLKKQNFAFFKNSQMNSQMDITSSEMLYHLQQRLEEKLIFAKNIVCDIPRLHERCDRIKNVQKKIDEKLERILLQQNLIANYSPGFSHNK